MSFNIRDRWVWYFLCIGLWISNIPLYVYFPFILFEKIPISNIDYDFKRSMTYPWLRSLLEICTILKIFTGGEKPGISLNMWNKNVIAGSISILMLKKGKFVIWKLTFQLYPQVKLERDHPSLSKFWNNCKF